MHLTHFIWEFFWANCWISLKNIFSKNLNQLPYFKALFVGIFLPRRRSILHKGYFNLRWGAAQSFLWFRWGRQTRQWGSKLDQRCCKKWFSGNAKFRPPKWIKNSQRAFWCLFKTDLPGFHRPRNFWIFSPVVKIDNNIWFLQYLFKEGLNGWASTPRKVNVIVQFKLNCDDFEVPELIMSIFADQG